ncbi:MAG: nuclease-related domain-containing protein [Solirubrobacteraceae bacterium]
MKRLPIAYADRVSAGASAEARYRTLLHSWRAHNKTFLPLALIPLLAWVLACALLWPAHSSSFASFGVGAAIVLYVTVRLLLIPAHIERWRDGAEAKKQTAKQLRPLLRARDWTAVHDRASRYGNRDHIVVGPPCVYLLDTKAPVGTVTVEGEVMTVRRREDPEDHYEQRTLAGRMRGAAAELADDLGHETGKRPWVTPVVVIWAPFEHVSLRTTACSGYKARLYAGGSTAKRPNWRADDWSSWDGLSKSSQRPRTRVSDLFNSRRGHRHASRQQQTASYHFRYHPAPFGRWQPSPDTPEPAQLCGF